MPEKVHVELWRDGARTEYLAISWSNNGTFTWPIPAEIKQAEEYRIRLTDAVDDTLYAMSDAFIISAAPIEVILEEEEGSWGSLAAIITVTVAAEFFAQYIMREQMKSKADGGHGDRHAAFGQYMFLIPASIGDFVSDILFCFVASFDPDYYFLGIVAFLHLGACAFMNAYYGSQIYQANNRDDNHIQENKLAYAILMLLSLSSLELWALFPWNIERGEEHIDGFPPRGEPIAKAKRAACCEDFPQLIIQLTYLIAKRSRSSMTWFSLSFTSVSICVRLAYRALETQQAGRQDLHKVHATTTTAAEPAPPAPSPFRTI